ncbi:hypothetical protein G4H71_14560 [Rhodococcus triatomae]|nr:hypothetical protein [Rhodococcus triatomae]QNG20002.1 hypothetical protein G4H72_15815 [Rhodococcus triatomae]QNG24083.1 hypothetical protein G4H71_14560 [Rhodococcus triatomae]
MPIALSRVHAIRAVLTTAGDEWRLVVHDIPEVLRTSAEGDVPEVVWLTDPVEHVSGLQHSVLYRDYLSGRWYSTGSALASADATPSTRENPPRWASPTHERRSFPAP